MKKMKQKMMHKINFKKVFYFSINLIVIFVLVFGNFGAKLYQATTDEFTEDKKEIDEILPTKEAQEIKSDEEDGSTEGVISCSIGTVLGNALTTIITGTVSSLIGAVFKGKEVPTFPTKITKKDAGYFIEFMNQQIPILPSWDAIGYCLVNQMIVNIANQTKKWISNGFDGSPTFVDDPQSLFEDLAKYQASNFLESLGDGFLCEPFESSIKARFANEYNASYSDYGRCTLQDVTDNVEDFLSGDFEKGGWTAWYELTQNPSNQEDFAYEQLRREAETRISISIGNIDKELSWSSGVHSWRDKKTGKVLTPGKVVQAEIEQKLGLEEGRLVLADEFDEVLTELVNLLVKTALEETLDVIQ